MTSTFVAHLPCPQCGSKDNLGTYTDGHQYCFGCGYYKAGETNLGAFRNPPLSKQQGIASIPFDCTTTLPNCCQQWLKQYGLTNKEIEDLGTCWSESTGLLVFPMKEDTTIIGYIGRRFAGEGSKYVIRGKKTAFTKVYGKGDTLVFTEDLISAVKVARVTAAIPLFGTVISTFPLEFASYRLWLDKDKQIESALQCKVWKQYGYDMRPIITELDPKEYTTEQISKEIINDWYSAQRIGNPNKLA